MADESVEQKIFNERVAKAEALRTGGTNPYANGFAPANTATELTTRFAGNTSEELEVSKPGPFSVAGRVVGLRGKGKSIFFDLVDRTGRLQVNATLDSLGEQGFALFDKLDVADFVGVEGHIFRTRGRKQGEVVVAGDITLKASKLTFLTKSLRPMPGKYVGEQATAEAKAWAESQALADVEERYRRRYVDLLSNPGVRESFKKRTKLVQFIRNFLDGRDFLEVETPMMHPLVSGAAARPFKTHHNTFDTDLFLRIAPELYLKRLVVGGFDRVYEINRNFRNEGVSTRHNPEFTMLEFYQAYATYEDLMTLTEEMVSEAAQAVCGSTVVKYGEQTIDFKRGWARIPMTESIRAKLPELTERDFADPEKLRAVALKAKDVEAGTRKALETMNVGELIGFLFETYVEHTLVQPTFITQFPVETSPLARRNDANPAITDRFELFCVGREIANAFSELNDPADQEARFKAQVEAKGRGQQETMDYDEDYIRALQHGMPPTAGEGIGIDRLAMLLTDAQSIRDVILFPLLKPLHHP
jgi:lysyl-tRNA synthetase class 2